jgi:hypothetical protein
LTCEEIATFRGRVIDQPQPLDTLFLGEIAEQLAGIRDILSQIADTFEEYTEFEVQDLVEDARTGESQEPTWPTNPIKCGYPDCDAAAFVIDHVQQRYLCYDHGLPRFEAMLSHLEALR